MKTTLATTLMLALVTYGASAAAQCNWTIEDSFVSPDSIPTGEMGTSVAIHGNVMVAGRPRTDEQCPGDVGCNSGSAVVYRFDGSNWNLEQILYASDATRNDFFGQDVAVQGDVIVVGAPRRNGHGAAYSFTYDRSTGIWTEDDILVAGGAGFIEFGEALAFSGTVLVVGAPSEADSAGRAYIFQRQDGAWVFLDTLVAFDEATGDDFGRVVAIDGWVIVVGASGDDYSSEFEAGSAYVFRLSLSDSIFVFDQKLTASDFDSSDFFGFSVGIGGNLILVGAPFESQGGASAGAVYTYEYSGGIWSETGKLLRPGTQAGDLFGYFMNVTGWSAIITANSFAADTEILRFDGGDWEFEATANTGFAGDVAIGQNRAVIGNPDDDAAALNAGRVTVLQSGDADGDGLLDCWETAGIPIPNDPGTYMLPGADPMRKDLYVEVDYLSGYQFIESILDPVVLAFASAPIGNPDGSTGITLHIEFDDGDIPFNSDDWDLDAQFDSLKTEQFGTMAERADPNIVEAKKRAYRYCFVPEDAAEGAMGLGEKPGNDFIVALQPHLGVVDWQFEFQATFMHELGHTLGLGHGGGDDINFKANYVSVMNYLWTPTRAEGIAWPLDFSRAALASLDESALDETAPIGDPSGLYSTTSTMFLGDGCEMVCDILPSFFLGRPWRTVLIGSEPVGDWDADNILNETNVCADSNYLGLDGGWKSNPSPCEVLVGHDDWPALVYGIDGSGDFADKVHTTVPDDEATGDFLQWAYNRPTGIRDTPGPRYEYGLEQNIPNPFNPTTTIRFSLAMREHVAVRVYDVAGRLIRTLTDDVLTAGHHAVEWNGRDGSGRPVATGVYFCAVETESVRMSRKMVLLK